MATYAIGDIQGCQGALMRLLDELRFDPASDRLWLVGDLVNRGPDSLQVLRFVRDLGDRAVAVLGNHDLHLLAVAAGVAEAGRSDTLTDILAAPDREELLDWLRRRPLLHREGRHLMVHAGLLPQWDADTAQGLAAEVEAALRGPDYVAFLARMYGNAPRAWADDLHGYKRLRVIVNALTRLRVCDVRGEMDFKFKGVLEDIPAGLMPWYAVPGRASTDATVIFGHWSALGLRQHAGAVALDTGCLWGGALTAYRLEDGRVFQCGCDENRRPHR